MLLQHERKPPGDTFLYIIYIGQLGKSLYLAVSLIFIIEMRCETAICSNI
jgi:hypothetical protein